jgi:hypothetical protein
MPMKVIHLPSVKEKNNLMEEQEVEGNELYYVA